MKRPPESASSVMAVIAHIAGVRAGICMIAVPSRMRVVQRPDPGERRDRVGAVGLGGPHRVEAELLGLENEIHRQPHSAARVSDGQSELHDASPSGLLAERSAILHRGERPAQSRAQADSARAWYARHRRK